jgi:hypothetical protein
MPQDPRDDNEETRTPSIENLLVDLENIDVQDNEGFQACVLHHSRLQSLLSVWLHAAQLDLSSEDVLVMDELRQQLKLLLADQTHDKYLKTVSVFRAADYDQEPEKK